MVGRVFESYETVIVGDDSVEGLKVQAEKEVRRTMRKEEGIEGAQSVVVMYVTRNNSI